MLILLHTCSELDVTYNLGFACLKLTPEMAKLILNKIDFVDNLRNADHTLNQIEWNATPSGLNLDIKFVNHKNIDFSKCYEVPGYNVFVVNDENAILDTTTECNIVNLVCTADYAYFVAHLYKHSAKFISAFIPESLLF